MTAIRQSIVLILVLVSTSIALLTKTATAGLGWTLEECKKHYGEPTDSKANSSGVTDYFFSVKGFQIRVGIDKSGDGTAVGVKYIKSLISDDVITELLNQNPPNAVWQEQKNLPATVPDGARLWVGFANNVSYVAFFEHSFIGDSLTIGTHDFLFKTLPQQDKDDASGL